jgi:RNA binding exosome subunit
MRQRKILPEFASLTISFFIHATEDEPGLIGRVSSSLGVDPKSFELLALEGHFGNTIRSAKAHIKGEAANDISRKIIAKLDSQSKNGILLELEKSVDEHESLFLRLDRQNLGSTLHVGRDEPIRIKLKPTKQYGNRNSIMDGYRELIKS